LHSLPFVSCLLLRPHGPSLFPYTTLFRSANGLQPELVELFLVAAPAPPPGLVEAEEEDAAGTDELLEHERMVLAGRAAIRSPLGDRKSTRLNSSHVSISYAVFCLKKKKKK